MKNTFTYILAALWLFALNPPGWPHNNLTVPNLTSFTN